MSKDPLCDNEPREKLWWFADERHGKVYQILGFNKGGNPRMWMCPRADGGRFLSERDGCLFETEAEALVAMEKILWANVERAYQQLKAHYQK